MKVQLEVFLTSVHIRILTLTSSQLSSKKYSANDTAKEELALESLLEFCREPSLMQDLYTNYDCDVQCTDLFYSIISILCVRSIPYGSSYEEDNIDMNKNPINVVNKISIVNKLALDGVFAVLHSVGVYIFYIYMLYTYIYMYTYIYIYVHMYKYIYIYGWGFCSFTLCGYVYMLYVCYIYICICIYVFVYVCIYIYIRYICIHI
jgi:hypothetical protein